MPHHRSIDDAFKVRPPFGAMVAVTLGLVLGLSTAWLVYDFVSGGVVDWGRQMAQIAKVR
jgi:hypothetical protein